MGEPLPQKSPAEAPALVVRLDDEVVLAYLNPFPPSEWERRILEAARIGVIAIRSAGPALDARVVENAFQKTEDGLQQTVQDLERALKDRLEEYFRTRLDANNRESPFAKLDDAVRNHLNAQLETFVKEFSLDHNGSAVSRLKLVIEQQIKELDERHTRVLGEIQRSVGELKGRKEEAAAAPVKGFDFEHGVYEVICRLGQGYEDVTANVAETTGAVRASKVGDHEVTLSRNSGAPGRKIVFECKKKKDYSLKEAREELARARENRQAKVGVLVFAKGYEPAEIGDFRIIDRDIFCTVAEDQTPVFLEAAYKIARAMVVLESVETSGGLNAQALSASIRKAADATNKLSELKTRAESARGWIDGIIETVSKIQKTLESELESMAREIERASTRS